MFLSLFRAPTRQPLKSVQEIKQIMKSASFSPELSRGHFYTIILIIIWRNDEEINYWFYDIFPNSFVSGCQEYFLSTVISNMLTWNFQGGFVPMMRSTHYKRKSMWEPSFKFYNCDNVTWNPTNIRQYTTDIVEYCCILLKTEKAMT